MTVKNTFSSARRALALEQRILFDGAGAAAGADAFDGDLDNPIDNKPQSHQNPQQQRTALANIPAGARLAMGAPVPFANDVDVEPLDFDITDKGVVKLGDPVKVGEDTGENDEVYQKIGEDLTLDTKTTSIQVSVEKGTLNGDTDKVITLTGTVEQLENQLKDLTYRYAGDSETGDDDTLRITVTVGVGDDAEEKNYYRKIAIAPQNDGPVMDDTIKVTVDDKEHVFDRLKVDEGGSINFAGVVDLKNGEDGDNLGAYQANLGLYDPDNHAEQIIIKINSLPTLVGSELNWEKGYGHLELNGIRIGEGATLSLDEIGGLKYVHNGEQVKTSGQQVSFKITVDDGAGGELIKEEKVFIDLLPVNQAPSVSGSITMIQGEGLINLGEGGDLPVLVGFDRGQITGSDAEGEELTYVITEIPSADEQGILFRKEGEELIAVAKGDEVVLEDLYFEYTGGIIKDSAENIVKFKIQATDQGGGEKNEEGKDNILSSDEVEIAITVLRNNNDPYFLPVDEHDDPRDLGFVKDGAGNDTDIKIIDSIVYEEIVKEGETTITITKEMLPLHDDDTFEANRVFTVRSSNASPSGYFTIKTGEETLGLLDSKDGKSASFSYQDVLDGKVQYHLIGTSSEDRIDYIDFTVQDGAKTIVFPDSGDPYARDGGIYRIDTIDSQELQVFRLQVEVPEGVEGGDGPLPLLPGIATGFDIKVNETLKVNEGQGTLGESKGLPITDKHLEVGDGVSGDEKITIRLEKMPEHGELYLLERNDDGEVVAEKKLKIHDSFTQQDINNNNVIYKHLGAEEFADRFNFSVSNGSITTGETSENTTFHIDITPQNDSPIADDASVSLKEGSAIEIPVALSDPDNDGDHKKGGYDVKNTVGFRVKTLPEHGKLYLVDSGFDVEDATSVKALDEKTALKAGKVFTADDLNNHKLIYVHDGSENYKTSFEIVPIDDAGVPSEGKEVTDTNQSSEGAPATIDITIYPVNDAPTFVDKAEPKLAEDGTDTRMHEGGTITIRGAKGYSDEMKVGEDKTKTGSGTAEKPDEGYYLIYQDSDSTSTQRQYRVTEAPAHGKLMLNGKVLSVGSIFTQADLDSNKAITYEHDGSENHFDGFNYVVSDGDWTSVDKSGEEGADTKKDGNGIYEQGKKPEQGSRYQIEIAPGNKPPTIERDSKEPIRVESVSTPTRLGGEGESIGIKIGDEDFDNRKTDVDPDDEKDFVRVTVTSDSTDKLTFGFGDKSNEVTVITDVGEGGSVSELVFQGKKADVQEALNNILVTTTETEGKTAKIIVTVDDRLYNEDGELITDDDGNQIANGGAYNTNGEPINDKNNIATLEIEVWASAVNSPPVIIAPDSINVNEDGYLDTADNENNYSEGRRTKLESISYDDLDAFDTENNTLKLSVTHGSLYVNGQDYGKNFEITGTKAELQAALGDLYYSSPKDFNGEDTLVITVEDEAVGEDGDSHKGEVTKNVIINIIPVNDAPELGEMQEVTDEYVTLTGSHTFSDITFTDPDRAPKDGQGRFDDGHQYSDELGESKEEDTHEYTVTLKADIDGNTPFGHIKIINDSGVTVKNNDTGEVVITGTYDALHTALKNKNVTYTPDSNDPDAENENINFTITVNDNNDGGAELGGTGEALFHTQSFVFQRTDVNDAPEFAFGGANKDDDGANQLENGPTYVENSDKPVQLDPKAEVTDEELDLFSSRKGGSWAGAVLTVQRGEYVPAVEDAEDPENSKPEGGKSNVHEADKFDVSDRVEIDIDSGEVKVGSTVVGEIVSGQNGTAGILGIEFNENADSDLVNEVLKSITYRNEGEDFTDPKYGKEAKVEILYSLNDKSPENPEDEGGQYQGTGGELTGYGSVTVTINRQVVAKNDSNFVYEPTDENPIGQVKGDLTPQEDISYVDGEDSYTDLKDYDPDTEQIEQIEVRGITVGTVDSVKEFDKLNEEFVKPADGTTEIQGKYGKLVVKSNGEYTYTVDADNLTVQGLVSGKKLEDEVFTYKISDNQGANDEFSTFDVATLTITINGTNDGVTVDTSDKDGKGGSKESAHEVFESGLDTDKSTGSKPGEMPVSVQSEFTITALDGLSLSEGEDDKAVHLTFNVLNEEGEVVEVTEAYTKSEIEGLGTDSITIKTQYGTFELYDYERDAETKTIDGVEIEEGSGEIKIKYRYTLDDATSDHSKEGQDKELFDVIKVTANDQDIDVGNAEIHVKIVDDTPDTEDDTGEVRSGEMLDSKTLEEGKSVLDNDVPGADGWKDGTAAVVGVEKGDTKTPKTAEPNSEGAYVIEGEHGTLKLKTDGTYTYEANPNKVGEVDVFTYTVADNDGDKVTATLTITITDHELGDLTPVEGVDEVSEADLVGGSNNDSDENKAKVTMPLPLETSNGVTLKNPVLKGEPDANGGAQHGTVTINDDGTYTYELNKAVDKGITEDTFTYIAEDDYGNTVENTITIKIVDDKPTIRVDKNLEVLSGDESEETGKLDHHFGADGVGGFTVNGEEFVVPTVDNPTTIEAENGKLVVEANGSYTYKANPNTGGETDKFEFVITDGDGDTAEATINITITDHDHEGVDATDTVEEKHLSDGSTPDASKLKVEGDLKLAEGLTVDVPTEGWSDDHGTFEMDKDGNWSYILDKTVNNTPGADEVVKTFDYTATDKLGNSVTGTITIKVVDDVPAPEADTGNVESGKQLDVNAEDGVLKNDEPGADGWAKGTPAVIGVVVGDKVDQLPPVGNVGTTITGQHGTLTLHADGSYTYVAKPNTNGETDVFTYTIEDGDGDRVSTTLTIEIGEVAPESTEKLADTVYEADLRDGGTAQATGELPEGNRVQANSGDSDKGYGTFEIDENGNYTYTLKEAITHPVGEDDPTDSITYTYTDLHGNTVTKTVEITIVDDVPEAVADEATVSVGKTVSGNVTDNDEPGADGWGEEKVKDAGNKEGNHGTLELNADGTYTYTPNEEAKNGDVDVFEYTVVDADGDESTATLTIFIVDEQDPVANDDSYTTEEGKTATGNVLENDKNPDGDDDELKVVEVIVGGEPYEPGVEIPIAEGTITIDEDGNFTFEPEDGFSGEVKTPIEYKVVGEDGKTDTAKITVTVTPGPIPPVAVPDSNVIIEGETATGNILDNDYDPDGDDKDLKVTKVNGTELNPEGETTITIPEGTLVITPDGKYTFTPNDGYSGNVPPIEYEIVDPQGETDTSELLITVIPDPHAGKNPIANPDYIVTEQDTKVSGNIVGNDSSLSGGKLTVSQATVVVDGETITLTIGKNTDIPGVGKINIKKNGSYTFTPDKGFTGDVPTIDYEVVDSKGGKASSTLDIEVTPVAKEPEVPENQPPVARPDKDVIKEGEKATGNILTNDNDPDEGDSITVTEITVEGETYKPGDVIELKVNDEPIGTITIDEKGNYTFTPEEGFTGDIPTIDYTISDKDGLTDSSTLDIEVVPADPVNNLPPVANPDFDKIPQGGTSTGNLLANDKDPEGDKLTVTEITVDGVTYPLGEEGSVTVETPEGEITVNEKGKYTFTPDKDFVGDILTIGYQITDGKGGYETSTLDITVTPVEPVIPTGPVAKDDYNDIKEGEVAKGDILENDSNGVTVKDFTVGGKTYDPGDTAIIEGIGTITIDKKGNYTFTPEEGWSGIVPVIDYTIENDSGEDTAKLRITVVPEETEVPENETVLAVPDVKTTEMNKKATGNILTNDITTGEVTITEIDGKTFEDGKITIEFEGQGTITIDEKGNYTFTPADGYVGKVPPINYTIKDDNGESSSTLTITVLPKPEPETPKPETPRPDPQPEPEPEPEEELEPEPEEELEPEPEPEEELEPEEEFDPELDPEDTPESEQPQPDIPGTERPEQPELEKPVFKPQDDLNHVDYNPVEVPSSKPSELAVSEPSHRPLQVKNTLLDAQVQDPSVFFEGSISDKIQRMQVPLHPIVYVNRQVQESQAERALNDVASFSNPSAVTPGEVASISIGAGLGQDQNIFVVHAVRGTQEQAENLELQVSGRLSRVSLSSDGELATPGLFSDNADLAIDADTETPVDTDAEVDVDAAMDVEAPEQDGALSFSQQLQNSREFVVDMPLFAMAELN